jgi:uroporphyrinogen-III synthase
MRVVVTRPLSDALRTAERLRGLGHEPVLSPVLVVKPTGAPLPGGPFGAVLATSANAFSGEEAGPGLLATPLLAVGETTAAAARAAGFKDVHAEAGRATALAETVLARFASGVRLLYLAGRERTDALETIVNGAGYHLTVVETYAAEPAESLTAEARAALHDYEAAVLHYSARSAAIFLQLAIRENFAGAVLRGAHLCLSEAVAMPLREAGAAVRVAEKPDEEALLALLPPSR